MPHTPHEKKRVLARVRRIKGQIAALETALEAESECIAIMQQIAAVRGAVNGLMLEVMEAHINETFGKSATELPGEHAVTEVNALLRSYLK
ncbi:MAG: metal/formaldehyde-sensitive transcriptional repressor [bacterium]